MNEATGNTGARTPEQIFEVVNNYALTTLNLRKDEEEVMGSISMKVLRQDMNFSRRVK